MKKQYAATALALLILTLTACAGYANKLTT